MKSVCLLDIYPLCKQSPTWPEYLCWLEREQFNVLWALKGGSANSLYVLLTPDRWKASSAQNLKINEQSFFYIKITLGWFENILPYIIFFLVLRTKKSEANCFSGSLRNLTLFKVFFEMLCKLCLVLCTSNGEQGVGGIDVGVRVGDRVRYLEVREALHLCVQSFLFTVWWTEQWLMRIICEDCSVHAHRKARKTAGKSWIRSSLMWGCRTPQARLCNLPYIIWLHKMSPELKLLPQTLLIAL